jgi:hypothetical protein
VESEIATDKVKSRTALFAVIATLATTTSAAVPPEVPEVRTSQVYSPFDFSFGDGGERILETGSVAQIGYFPNQDLVYPLAPTGTSKTGDLTTFTNKIMNQSAGILLIDSHGGIRNISVEAYANSQAAFAAFSAYTNPQTGIVQPGEIVVAPTSDGYYAIAVTCRIFESGSS